MSYSSPKTAIKGALLGPEATMVIREVVSGITTLSVPFELIGKVKTGGRGTIVRLSTGSLVIFSPVSLTPEVRTIVEKLGVLRYIVALNIEHHLFISAWATAYPDAEVIGMEGLPEKREKSEKTRGVKFTHIFTAENKTSKKISSEFDAEFEYEYVDSHQNKELVFFHKSTKTFIEADLLFNLPATEQFSRTEDGASSGILTKLSSGLLHVGGDMKWQKRILWYLHCSSDRDGFGKSAKRILEWNPDRIIPCHGDVINSGGNEVLERLTEWFREGKR